MYICKNFVMRVVALPTASLKGLILATRVEGPLAEEQLASKIELILNNTRLIFFPGMKSKPWKRSMVKPSQSITKVGTQMDFSELGINPERTRSDLTLML